MGLVEAGQFKALNNHIIKKPTQIVSFIIRACILKSTANYQFLAGMTSAFLNYDYVNPHVNSSNHLLNAL